MDEIKDSNTIENRKKNLKKESLIVYFIMLFGYVISYFVYATAVIYMFPIVNFIMLLLDLDYVFRYTINILMDLFFKSIPLSFIIVGRVKLSVNNDKLKNLYSFDIYEKKDVKKISKKEDEKQKKIIDDIMIKIEKLPRSKQMELLNYIKGYELLSENSISSEIDMLSDENVSFLQDKFEDILFSDFNSNEDVCDYSRKRKK